MDIVAEKLANLPSSGPIALALGEYADADGAIQSAIVRQLFWDAVARVSPETIAAIFRTGPTGWRLELGLPEDAYYDMRESPGVSSGADRIYVPDFLVKEGLAIIQPGARRGGRLAITTPGDENAVVVIALPPQYTPARHPVRLDTYDALTWDPLTETRAAAKARLLVELEARLDAGLDQVEADYANLPVAPPIEKRRIEHFDWLVRYQVRGESMSAIAADLGVNRTTVRDAIHGTAALVGLSLRPADTGGRPRKPGV